MNRGFYKVAAAIPSVHIGDCKYNRTKMQELAKQADRQNVEAIVFPEMSLTSYTAMDLFFQRTLLSDAVRELGNLTENTKDLNIIIIAGLPLAIENKLVNAAAVINGGKLLGLSVKTYIPNYKEFQELRWFTSANDLISKSINLFGYDVPIGNDLIFDINGELKFAIEICEDLWVPAPPSSGFAIEGADIIFNPSATNELISKNDYLKSLIRQQSARCISGYVYASAGFGESSTDLAYAGNGIIADNGKIIKESERFSIEQQLIIGDIYVNHLKYDRMLNDSFAGFRKKGINESCRTVCLSIPARKTEKYIPQRTIEPTPFVPSGPLLDERCEEIFNIQTFALAERLRSIKCKNVVIGISGGLDSTLALLVANRTFHKLGYDTKGITGITMPGFGTTGRTHDNAVSLMKELKISIKEISIKEACSVHFKDIGQNPSEHDVTYENCQARERTQILMDTANKIGGIVIGTGDLSEIALGWDTYNGDHMSMYAVNCGIPKTLVKYLVIWVAEKTYTGKARNILMDIADTPISPELIPADKEEQIVQKTEDLVGPYELHDFFIYHTVRYGSEPEQVLYLAQIAFGDKYSRITILKWLKVFYKRFFSQQFKRNCMPDGPKVGSISFSPRSDWRMPSDSSAEAWIRRLEDIS
ncbi:MAG: NAD(+) synthase [Bacteroidales bacterium]|jgi:NAD+ synthase (glutamine-hydrolysing)|nr:NAD(+) synthase [Bacteroidales bacterium]